MHRGFLGCLPALALALAACGGADYDVPDPSDYTPPETPPVVQQPGSDAVCDSIPSGGAELDHNVSGGCLECGVTDSAKAADGDLSTYASVQVAADLPTQGVSLRAKAQPGIAYPAGSVAGANITTPETVIEQLQYAVEIRTYLGGAQQEAHYTEGGPTSFGTCTICGGHNNTYEAFKTTMPFDAVEVFISNTAVAGSAFKVHEICSDIRD